MRSLRVGVRVLVVEEMVRGDKNPICFLEVGKRLETWMLSCFVFVLRLSRGTVSVYLVGIRRK